jgi:hypothetical protein
MKLTINFNGNEKGFSLEQQLEADISKDATALGYISMVLFESSQVLAAYCVRSNPKYHDLMDKGVQLLVIEKENGNNDHYPFTTFIVEDEK